MENHTKNDTGYLKVILGCMFSGKTSELMKEYNKYKSCGCQCLFINHKLDKRYTDDEGETVSHNGQVIKSINVGNKLFDYFQKKSNADEYLSLDEKCSTNEEKKEVHNYAHNISRYDVIFINEGQFFEDLYPFINYTVDTLCKRVYVCGLDGDFQRKKFGSIFDIIPLCDELIKLYAICGECKVSNGIFTHRLTDEKKQTVIGSDIYIPLCRKCYNEKNMVLL